jgi:phosphatidylserine decarboxylase
MATPTRTPACPPLTPAPITSIQPGGGLGLRLALAWGRLRRAWLKRFRPGYVRRMAEKREGPTGGCPHEVLDPRDLKYFRNVCACTFRGEPDELTRRGRLPLARAGLPEVVYFSVLLGLLVLASGALAVSFHPALWALAAVFFILWAFVLSFFRDPERAIPADPDALVSPADGTVTHADEADEPDFPGGRAFRVGIFLSVFNVHVNRLPRSGRVLGLRYYPGRFVDARAADCPAVNEQFWVDLGEGGPGQLVRVKQIAGAVARRIVCWLRPGEPVKAGDRFGMIKFGSRTEVFVPADAVKEVLVRPGDAVKGGSTVLLRMKS